MTNLPQYDLTPAKALERLREELAKHKADPNRSQLRGMNPDDAWDAGYAMAVRDLESLTGPDPRVEFDDAVTRLAEMENEK